MRKLENSELSRLSKDEFSESAKTPLILVLDNVRSHLNVGSVFRTADAFRVEKIYLCGITGIPPHRDIQKTALGATDTVAWEHREDTLSLIQELQEQGMQIASIEQAEQSIPLHSFQQGDQKLVLIFGNEVEGVQQSVVNASDAVIEIPQFGSKHSLNISVSAGIAIWEFAKPFFPQLNLITL